jgi:hypothetical protein
MFLSADVKEETGVTTQRFEMPPYGLIAYLPATLKYPESLAPDEPLYEAG